MNKIRLFIYKHIHYHEWYGKINEFQKFYLTYDLEKLLKEIYDLTGIHLEKVDDKIYRTRKYYYEEEEIYELCEIIPDII